MSEDFKPIVVTCDVYWACLDHKNELANKYQVDLCNLSDKAVEALEENGIGVLNKPDRAEQGNYITVKSNNTIKAYNTDGDDLSGIKVGNGSKARAVLGYYDWTFSGKKGRSASLKKLIIDDLVVFEGSETGYDLSEAI